MYSITIGNYEISSTLIFDDDTHFALDEVQKIVFEFNKIQYAGHFDWRLPSRDDWENLISCKKKFQKELYLLLKPPLIKLITASFLKLIMQ